MYCAGIDVGSLTAEYAVVKEGRLIASARCGVLPNPVESARKVSEQVFADHPELRPSDIAYTIATGYGRERLEAEGLAQKNVSEISCHGFGAFSVDSRVRTIVDVGGQDAKCIKVDERGELVNFGMNDKCAAGTGHFLELMCRTLDLSLEELGPLALGARNPVHMSSRCSIFVETEVIHFLQRGVPLVDVAAGINRALAERVSALVRRIKPEPAVTMTGGVAKNVAVKRELEKRLNVRMLELAIDPQLVGAFGAAMLAAREVGEG